MTDYQKKRLAGSAVIAGSATAVWIFVDLHASREHMHRLTLTIILVALLVNSAYWAVLARSN